MINLINSIIDRDFIEADSFLEESVQVIMSRKLEEAKKMYAAKMTEQGNSMNRTASQLVRLGVVEEDNIEEMDLSREKPDYANIEDRRGMKDPSWFMKNVNIVKTSPKTTAVVTKEPNSSVVQKTAMKEEESLEEARINIIKARIRGGKIQRRKKVSNVPGMTLRGGKLQRMSAAERRRRKMGARKAVRKRMPKMNRALMKRKRSLMKRRALGL
jgi:hypothetical protein